MDIKALIKCNIDIQNVIDELKCESEICEYELLKQEYISMPPDVIIIIFEILNNLGMNATYDLLKMALLQIISKISTLKKQEPAVKETTIIVVVDGRRTEVNMSFELSEKQKNKVVDAAIRKLFE